MTSHEERAYAAEAMIGVHLQTASHPEVVKLLAAEFAAVEAEAQKRVAVLEAALIRLQWDQTDGNGNDCCGECGSTKSEGHRPDCPTAQALSGEPTALLALLERAAQIAGAEVCDCMAISDHEAADIAKRVWESHSDDIVRREGR